MNVLDIITPVLTPVVEIGVIAIILNYLLSFFWHTKSMDLLIGLLAFFVMFAISTLLNLPILYTIMSNLMNVAAVGLIMIFQPELRVALSRLSLKGKRYREVLEFDKFLDQLTNSIYRLAEKRIGALIALEHTDKLDEFAQKGVVVNGLFSSELLETIFSNSTPLHDGAVIIRDCTIIAASAIFPLADESVEFVRSTGTRHRAAVGLSQISDALVIVISEQTGRVAIARKGAISNNVKPNQFKGVAHSIFTAAETKLPRKKSLFQAWMRG